VKVPYLWPFSLHTYNEITCRSIRRSPLFRPDLPTSIFSSFPSLTIRCTLILATVADTLSPA
jgi:hypothetical protein